MRRTLCTLAVTATAFVTPLLASGTAHAADSTAVAPSGCLTTYVSNVEHTSGDPLVRIYGLTVTVDAGPTVAYANAQVGNTEWLVFNCLY